MKKMFLLLGLTAFIAMSFVSGPELKKVDEEVFVNDSSVPADVKKVIDNKCYGCHNSESKNEKGKKKLSFDKLSALSVAKQVGKYEEIHEVVTEAKMPPKKFLAKYPDKALSADETKALLTWAKDESDKLMK